MARVVGLFSRKRERLSNLRLRSLLRPDLLRLPLGLRMSGIIPPAYLMDMIPRWRDQLVRVIARCEAMGDPLGELPMLRADLDLAERTIRDLVKTDI